MSFRWRLAFSYFILIAVPLLIGLIGLAGIFFALIGRVPSFEESLRQPGNPIIALFDRQLTSYAALQDVVRSAPDLLLQPERLTAWENEAAAWNAGLLIWKDGVLVHQSPALQQMDATWLRWEEKDADYADEVQDWMDDHGQPGAHAGYGMPHGKFRDRGFDQFRGSHGTVIKTWTVQFADRSSGEIWLVSDQGLFGRFVSDSFGWFVSGLAFVLILTMSVLVWGVSRTVVRPLRTLTEATERMQAGDLNFTINLERKDEIGRLAASFDRMRARLLAASEQAQLDEQNRKELIANISHDLRTPVTAIRGYAEAMVDGLSGNQQTDLRYASQIVKKAKQLQHLIQELFELSLLEMGQKKFSFEPVELTGFLSDCTDEWRMDLEDKQIAVTFEKTDFSSADDPQSEGSDPAAAGAVRPLIVQADRSELQRVLANLLDNAVKSFQGNAGEVIFRLQTDEGGIRILISDNGCGIPEALVPYIFDRFTRADASRGSAGAGLGLAIAKQIIRAHGGSITADSEEGKGTTITILLPWKETMTDAHTDH